MMDFAQDYQEFLDEVAQERPDLTGIVMSYRSHPKSAMVLYNMCYEIADYEGLDIQEEHQFSVRLLLNYIKEEIMP